MKKTAAIITAAVMLAVFFCWKLPSSKEIRIAPLPAKTDILLLPLDSRPVCTSLPQKLGNLAGFNVILPPKELLDNYQTPADREKLYQWLQTNGAVPAVISADLLVHGGLLQGRQYRDDTIWQQKLLQELSVPGAGERQVFSVVPRLLVSDELLPDRWYSFHLMRYSRLFDMAEISSDPFITQEMLHMKARIDPKVLDKYTALYRQSEAFNRSLIMLAGPELQVFIGQDDSMPLGLPHRSFERLRALIRSSGKSPYAQMTYGADEIAAVLLARLFLQQQKWQPKIFIVYADPASEFHYMPYMGASTGQTLRNKLQLLGAQEAADAKSADIILYVNCGSDSFRPSAVHARQLQQLIDSGTPAALLDLSANFAEEELLMPDLLDEGVQLNRLAAYSGWNTLSNSAGTVLAQAVIFAGRYRSLQQIKEEKLRRIMMLDLHAANLRFTAERLLDDYVYQKQLHAALSHDLLVQGITAASLSPAEKASTESFIQGFLSLRAELLLHRNLGRTPFYSDEYNDYYLKGLQAAVQLPWNRIFEVKLEVYTQTGRRSRI